MIYNQTFVALCPIVGAAMILFAHGTIHQWMGVPLTWRITDSANGRLWLSFAVVLTATLPARMDTLPVWLCIIVVLTFTAAFYTVLDRWILLPIPHKMRQITAKSGERRTYVDNRKPVGYRWLNQRTVAA